MSNHGSLVNTVMGNSATEPEVGMGATIISWSDRHAATIIKVAYNRRGYVTSIVVQEDDAKRTDSNGMSDAQSYEYTPNTNNSTTTFTLRQNGRWVRQGESMKGGQRCAIGYRDTHHDYSF
jgi:hypothetical protein